MKGTKGRGEPREPRKPLEATIEFIGEFDIVEARGVDISANGLCFEVAEPLTFDMRITHGGEPREMRGRLMWVRAIDDGPYRCGFEVVPVDTLEDF